VNRSSFQALADRLNDPLLLVATDGVVIAANAAGEGLVEEPLIGADLATMVGEPDKLRRYLSLASRSSQPLPGTLRLSGPTDTWRCDASGLSTDEGHRVVMHLRTQQVSSRRFVALNRQIERLNEEIQRRRLAELERAALLERERELRKAAERASQVKDELLAAVSHELRTPLHAISGWVNVLRRTPEDRELVLRGLDIIDRNVSAEKQLTDDLVDTALTMTGRVTLSIEPVDLDAVVRDAVAAVQVACEAKQQHVVVTSELEDATVNGDPVRLTQVVRNLLSNATEYTPAGGRIRVELRPVGSRAEIAVSDTGEGIDEALLPYVFDRFRRGDGSATRRHGGLGLGLALVRELVELHEGVVMAHSDGPGTGATFVVSLPLPAFERQEVVTQGSSSPGSKQPLEGLRAFVVEDHTDSRELLCLLLQSSGAVVQGFERAAPVYSAFEEHRPDVILSDIEMPEEDGFTMMRKLRALERSAGAPQTPAIAVTAHAFDDAHSHAMRAGFQSFFTKPVDPDVLILAVDQLCRPRAG